MYPLKVIDAIFFLSIIINVWILLYFICFTLLLSLFLLITFCLWLLGAPSNCFSFDHEELLHIGSCDLLTWPQWTSIASLFSRTTRYSRLIPAPHRNHPFSQGVRVPFREKWYLEITVLALGVLMELVIASRPFSWKS